MADSDQRREFLTEIELMKNMGSHKNIVNMLGCCTVQEPMFLLVEYVPYGDLLHYLRKRRTKVESNTCPLNTLKGHCHEYFAVLGQFCAKLITLRL